MKYALALMIFAIVACTPTRELDTESSIPARVKSIALSMCQIGFVGGQQHSKKKLDASAADAFCDKVWRKVSE